MRRACLDRLFSFFVTTQLGARTIPNSQETRTTFQPADFRLEVYEASRRLQTCFSEARDKHAVVQLTSVSVYDHNAREKWYAFNKCDQGEKSIYDHRNDPRGHEVRPMSDFHLSLCVFAELPFGEFNDLGGGVSSYLQNEGLGSFA